MAAFTSKATGNWGASGQTTWNEVGVPGNGDTVSIAGPHVVTVDDARTIGNSPAAGNNVVTLSGSGANYGKLVIATGGHLTVRGDLRMADRGHLEMAGGSQLTFDASAASAPTTTQYKLYDSNGSDDYAVFRIIGTSDSARAVITSNITGGAKIAKIDVSQFHWGGHDVEITWAHFSNLETIKFIECSRIVVMDTVFASTCAATTTGVRQGGGDWTFTRLQYLSQSQFSLDANGRPATTGLRVITDSAFDGKVDIRSDGWAITDNVFNRDFGHGNTYASMATWDNNFIRRIAGSGSGGTMPGCALLDNTFLFFDNSSNSNPHYFGMSSDNKPATVTWDRWIVEADVTGSGGDVLFPNNSGATIVQRCLTLPNFDGGQPGCFLNVGTCAALTVEHNTFITAGGQDGVAVAEIGDTPANAVDSLRSNLAYRLSNGNGAIFTRSNGVSPRADIATPATTGYNAMAGVTGPPSGSGEYTYPGYTGITAGAMFTTPPSAATTDVSVAADPFLDSTRGVRTYAVLRGLASGGDSNATKKTALWNALLAIPNPADANYDAAVTIADMMDWIRAGFAPTDAALQAAHDSEVGGWIGAVEGVAAGVAPSMRLMLHS